MANTFSPFGFRSFGHQDGSPPTMGLSKYTMNSSYATSVYTGDLVKLSSAIPGTIEQFPAGLNATIKPLGVFAGCEYYNANVQRVVCSQYFPTSAGSSSPVTAYVISDPEMTFIAQASTGTVVGTSLQGMNIAFTVGTGNTTNGMSGAYLNSSQVGTAASSYVWRVVDSYSNFGPPGVNGTSTSEGGGILVVQPVGWMRNTVTLTGVST